MMINIEIYAIFGSYLLLALASSAADEALPHLELQCKYNLIMFVVCTLLMLSLTLLHCIAHTRFRE